MPGITVVVSGGRRYSNVKCLHRALDAVHQKHHISRLVTGERAGAEEMAHFWGVQRRIRAVITVPATPDLNGRYSRDVRNSDVLREYQPDAIVVFNGVGGVDRLAEMARERGYQVWEVPDDYG